MEQTTTTRESSSSSPNSTAITTPPRKPSSECSSIYDDDEMVSREASSSSSTVATPPKPSSKSSIYSDNENENGESAIGRDLKLRIAESDKWPVSKKDLTLQAVEYDGLGFLVDFEHTSAYTNPRAAPSPSPSPSPQMSHGKTLALKAARSTPSPHPGEPLPLLPVLHLIGVPYDAIAPWREDPPARLPTGPVGVKLGQAYRSHCIEQSLSGKQVSNERGRFNLQGYWLWRGTLRGFVKPQFGNGLKDAYDKRQSWAGPEELSVLKLEQAGSMDGSQSGSTRALFSRVRNSVRRGGRLTRLSLSISFSEFARTAERVGFCPSS